MNTVFTICSINFFRRAVVMLDSVLASTPDVSTVIFIMDCANQETQKKINLAKKNHSIIFAASLGIYQYNQMCFKYNVVEMNTAIKPDVFRYLFKNSTKKAVYLDPDILVFNDLSPIFSTLDNFSTVLTPHVISDDPSKTSKLTDLMLNMYGAMNLGFIALLNDCCSNRLLSWWEKKLFDGAFDDKYSHSAYDQKWADRFSCFFGQKLYIERHPGYNFAAWNIHERELIQINKQNFVRFENINYPLVFFHFSGYKLDSNILNYRFPDIKINDSAPLQAIVSSYNQLFELVPEPTLDKSIYGYSHFSNNIKILTIHRRFYRQLVKISNIDPFNAKNPFYKSLENARLLGFNDFSTEIELFAKSKTRNVSAFLFQKVLRLLFSLLGLNRYLMLLHGFYWYSSLEKNSFFIEKKYKSLCSSHHHQTPDVPPKSILHS